MRERRIDYKTKGARIPMFRRTKSVEISPIQRLRAEIIELQKRVDSLEKEIRVLKRTAYSRR